MSMNHGLFPPFITPHHSEHEELETFDLLVKDLV